MFIFHKLSTVSLQYIYNLPVEDCILTVESLWKINILTRERLYSISFNVDFIIWVFTYWILEKAISDQLKYTILLKLVLLELPRCLIVLSYLFQHTLNTWVWLFLDTNKMDLLRNKAVLYSTTLEFRRIVFFSCFLFFYQPDCYQQKIWILEQTLWFLKEFSQL
jgi:hypothetical protein